MSSQLFNQVTAPATQDQGYMMPDQELIPPGFQGMSNPYSMPVNPMMPDISTESYYSPITMPQGVRREIPGVPTRGPWSPHTLNLALPFDVPGYTFNTSNQYRPRQSTRAQDLASFRPPKVKKRQTPGKISQADLTSAILNAQSAGWNPSIGGGADVINRAMGGDLDAQNYFKQKNYLQDLRQYRMSGD